jgi:hypothetical protein
MADVGQGGGDARKKGPVDGMSQRYDFLSDDEAVSFVALISAELLNIAQAMKESRNGLSPSGALSPVTEPK